MQRFVSVLLFAVAACAAPSSSSTSTRAEPPSPPSAPESPLDETAACAINVVPLTLTYADGVADSQLVPVRVGAEEGWLAIDTGSALTFLYGPDSLEKRPIEIGCETLPVITRDFPRESHGGRPILGVMGADFFVTKTTDVDYPGGRIVRYANDVPVDTTGYSVVRWEDAEGHIAVRVAIDGRPHVLLYDTGATHALLLGESGRPRDEETAIQDVDGNIVRAWLGDSEVQIGSEVEREPVLRVPEWPYFASYAKELHPEMAGLFGRHAMGFRRIVVEPKTHLLRLGPIRETP
jgi:hypothetical protein